VVLQANLQWRHPLTPLNPAAVQYIVLHHAEAATATPDDIHRWHLERDGGAWAGGGYNEYIRKD
jgi:hypothetical protein